MKLGVMNPVLSSMKFEDALKYLSELGVQTIEIGAGGYPGNAHLDPVKLLADPEGPKNYLKTLEKYGIEISAISCHGNPLHPQAAVAESFDRQFKNAILAAEALGVDTVVGFSGCPGDCENSMYPNWVTCPWPDDHLKRSYRIGKRPQNLQPRTISKKSPLKCTPPLWSTTPKR